MCFVSHSQVAGRPTGRHVVRTVGKGRALIAMDTSGEDQFERKVTPRPIDDTFERKVTPRPSDGMGRAPRTVDASAHPDRLERKSTPRPSDGLTAKSDEVSGKMMPPSSGVRCRKVMHYGGRRRKTLNIQTPVPLRRCKFYPSLPAIPEDALVV